MPSLRTLLLTVPFFLMFVSAMPTDVSAPEATDGPVPDAAAASLDKPIDFADGWHNFTAEEITQLIGPVTADDTDGEANVDFTRLWSYKCETSSGSPTLQDVYIAADKLAAKPQTRCVQTNDKNSMCKRMANFGSASLGICGTYQNWIWCRDVVSLADAVAYKCSSSGRTGFTIVASAERGIDVKIIAYHS